MVVKRLNDKLSDGKRFYHERYFIWRLVGQTVVLLSVFFASIQTGSLPAPTSLAGVFLFSALFWRRRLDDTFAQTHLYMAVQTVIASLAMWQAVEFGCLFMVLVGQSMVTFKTRTGLIWVAVLWLIFLVINWRHPEDALFTPEGRAVVATALMAISGLVSSSIVNTSRDRDRIRNLLTDLRGAHAQLQRYAGQAEFLAAAAERERIARDLHDTLGHRLTVAVVQLEGARRLADRDPRQAAGMIETVRSQLMTGMSELRQTVQALRGHRINRDNLVPTLQQAVYMFEAATGIACHWALPDALPVSLSDEECVALYRIVQEALTNVQKHAEALNIWVDLEVSEGALILRVRNDGRDFGLSNDDGFGLRGMRERAEQFGGDLRVTIPAEGGTLVLFSLPIGETAGEEGMTGS